MQQDIIDKIQSILEQTPCYVLYNKETLVPTTSSGQPFNEIPDNSAQAQISYSDHKSLIDGTVDIRKSFIKIDNNNHAKICSIDLLTLPSVYINSPNTIKDLNPAQAFFDYLGIPFTINNNILTIEFSADVVNQAAIDYFEQRVRGSTIKYKLCITDYADPTVLHETIDINMSSLYHSGKLEYTLSNNYKRVSVWAIK